MDDGRLFLGLALTEDLKKQISSLSPDIAAIFLNDEGGNYLTSIEVDGKTLIGKHVGSTPSVAELELVSCNIQSIVKKLAPNFLTDNLEQILLSHEYTR